MPSACSQLELELSTPVDHHEQLHRAPHGTVLYWERAAPGGHRWKKCHPEDTVLELIGAYAGADEIYLSVNQFYGWRLVQLLKSLRAVYVDVDGTNNLDRVLECLREARMPAPSLAVRSGNGLHLYWLLEPTPAQALPVWQLVENALVAALYPLGADTKARDCTRVLRLAGSRHAEADAEVRGQIVTGERWSLHELSDAVGGARVPGRQRMDKSRRGPARVRDIKTRQSPSAARSNNKGSIYHRWHHVYRDLHKIAQHHGSRIPEGSRDAWLFLIATSLSWFAAEDALADEIDHAGRLHTDLTESQIQAYTKCVVDRAQRSARGEKIMWQGQEVDPRYHFRRQTLLKWCGDLITPDLQPQLRAIIPDELARERKLEGDRERWRQKHDSVDRATYEQNAAQRRERVHELSAKGYQKAAIARELGVTPQRVGQILQK